MTVARVPVAWAHRSSHGLQVVTAGDAALACPDDRRRSALDADLAVQGGNVVAHGVLRQAECARHLRIVLALADQAEDLAFPRAQIAELGSPVAGGAAGFGLADRLEFLDDGAREPRRAVGQDALDD